MTSTWRSATLTGVFVKRENLVIHPRSPSLNRRINRPGLAADGAFFAPLDSRCLDGVYRRDVIVKNNIKFIAGLHHQDIVWTTEFMFNALRARYTEQSLYKYYLHNTSVSRLHRQGNKNLNYQRHYIKITRLLEKLNRNYADKITIYPEFHQQITYEALRVCHAVRKEPDILTRQRMIAEIFTSGMYKRLITNVRSVKVGYQALLWSFRLWQWRDKTRSHHRITRSAFNLR